MSCEYVKLDFEGNLRLWIDIEQDFNEKVFYSTIREFSGISVLNSKNVFESMGPAQVISEITTNKGSFHLSMQFEDVESGIDIYSENRELMEEILSALTKASIFHERGKQIKVSTNSENITKNWWRFW